MKKLFNILLILFTLQACGNKNNAQNILLLPKELAMDTANNRLFVADLTNNNFSVINTQTNVVVGEAPLLNKDSSLQIPDLPQDMVVQNLGSGVSRIFILGNGETTNEIIVLDYDSSNGLQAASISPIVVGTNGDLLGGLALDSTNNHLFISNSSSDELFVFNTQDGTEDANSQITVSDNPSRMSFNSHLSRLFISSASSNNVSIINTADFSAAVESLDVGAESTDVASISNNTGSALAVLYPSSNSIRIFNLDTSSYSSSTALGSEISPVSTGTSLATTDALSGAASRLAATTNEADEILFLISQSTSDLGNVSVSADLTTVTTSRIGILNANTASDLEVLEDSNGHGSSVYIAAPNASAVSIVNLITLAYSSQIL